MVDMRRGACVEGRCLFQNRVAEKCLSRLRGKGAAESSVPLYGGLGRNFSKQRHKLRLK